MCVDQQNQYVGMATLQCQPHMTLYSGEYAENRTSLPQEISWSGGNDRVKTETIQSDISVSVSHITV